MKAAVYYETGKPDVFRYEDLPDPVCRSGGVLIDVKAVSIEGGDVLNRAGGEMPSKPHIVGYQCAGIIREAGDGVADRQAGQAVVALMPFGSHASLISVAAMQTWAVPAGLDIQQAACVPIPFGTANDCLFEFGHLSGETVLSRQARAASASAASSRAKRRRHGNGHRIQRREAGAPEEFGRTTGSIQDR
jgi:NADPH2:quinone reductase